MKIRQLIHGSKELTILSVLLILSAFIAPKAWAGAIEDQFSKFKAGAETKVDHSAWDKLLKTYIKQGDDGLNRVDYKAFKKSGHQELKSYIQTLEAADVTGLSRNEQFAFWANLYNAKTIDVILEHYPIPSIRDIDISPGLFADGPWGKKLLVVNKTNLSLDDIEHKILRGLWKDPRVHYAVNCASVGCPNLATSAYTGEKLDAMLIAGAKAYINSPRGVKVKDNRVTVSKIYSWFNKDFGRSKKNILQHIKKYTSPELTEKLKKINDIHSYEYDWALNDVNGN